MGDAEIVEVLHDCRLLCRPFFIAVAFLPPEVPGVTDKHAGAKMCGCREFILRHLADAGCNVFIEPSRVSIASTKLVGYIAYWIVFYLRVMTIV